MSKRICPMMSSANQEEPYQDCLEAKCAWWIPNNFLPSDQPPGSCAVKEISGGLDRLITATESLRGM